MYKHENSKGTTYYLNTKNVTTKGGTKVNLYFFSKDKRSETGCELPAGYEVAENPRNHFVTLRKTGK